MKYHITFICFILLSGVSFAFVAVKETTLYTKDTPCDNPDVVYMLDQLPAGSSVTVTKYETDFTVHKIASPITTRNGVSWYWVQRLYPPNPKDESRSFSTHFFDSCEPESNCICTNFVSGVGAFYMCKASDSALSHYDERFTEVKNVSPGIFTKVINLWGKSKRNGFSDLLRLAEELKIRPDFKEDISSNINALRIESIEVRQFDAYYFSMKIVGGKRWSVMFDIIDDELTFTGIGGPSHIDLED